jgi:chromosome segregation ATPase
MKKQFIEFLKAKGPTKKEINLSFTQCQDKNSESKKINDESKENPDNQSLGQIEVSFWKKSLSQLEEQLDSLKSFDYFKERQLSLLKYELNINTNESIEKTKKENEIKLKEIKNKYKSEESKLNDELSYLKKIQDELMEFTLTKSKIKKEINNLKNKIQFAQKDKKTSSKKSAISFNKIDASEIQRQYKGIMTTTHGELCRSKLGNKLLLSLNVDEINKYQVFDRTNLAYPVLKRKKIQFSYLGDGFNTKKLGKKKINLNDFNNFKVAGLPDGVQTVY